MGGTLVYIPPRKGVSLQGRGTFFTFFFYKHEKALNLARHMAGA